MPSHSHLTSPVAGAFVALAAGAAVATAPGAAATASTASAAATPAASACAVSDASLTWGFKESFRSYISGSIAKGTWETAGGATYETPAFTWSGASGTANGSGATGTGSETTASDSAELVRIDFTGSIRFTGHGGLLDTTVADPTLVVTTPTSATLLLDVTGTTQEGEPVASTDVPFATVDLSATPIDLATGGSVVITDAPAALAEEGAAAFGTYPVGESLDPVSASFAVVCATPTPTAAPVAEAGSAEPPVDAQTTLTADQSASSAAPFIVGFVAVTAAAIAAVVAFLTARRRRVAREAAGEASDTSPPTDPEETP